MMDDYEDLTLLQHGFERTAGRLKQMRNRNETDVQLMAVMLQFGTNCNAFKTGAVALEAIEKLRAALIAVQIDLESTIFSMETAHLRATTAARFVMVQAMTVKELSADQTHQKGADDEKQ
jgi:hypothetical protein